MEHLIFNTYTLIFENIIPAIIILMIYFIITIIKENMII